MRAEMEARLQSYKEELRQEMLERWSEQEAELRAQIMRDARAVEQEQIAALERKAVLSGSSS